MGVFTGWLEVCGVLLSGCLEAYVSMMVEVIRNHSSILIPCDPRNARAEDGSLGPIGMYARSLGWWGQPAD